MSDGDSRKLVGGHEGIKMAPRRVTFMGIPGSDD